MYKKMSMLCATALLYSVCCPSVQAQGAAFDLSSLNAASAGSQGNTTYATGQGPSTLMYSTPSNPTGQQSTGTLPQTALAGLAPVFGITNAGLFAMGGFGGYGIPGPNGIGVFGPVTGGYAAGGAAGWTGPGAPQAVNTPAQLAAYVPSSSFAQNHPLRTEVLTGDSSLQNELNGDYGWLGGQYRNLTSQAGAIANQEEGDAAQNGGYITRGEQAQLNGEEANLQQQINSVAGIPGF